MSKRITEYDWEGRPIQQHRRVNDRTDFTPSRRILIIMIVSFCGCLGPLATTILLPLHSIIKEELRLSDKVLDSMLHAFLGVSALCSLVWGQLSDVYGRRCVYLISLSIFLVASILLTTLPASLGVLYGLHVAQAVGSSSGFCVGMGTVVDVTPIKKRFGAFGLFMIGPSLGYIIGPIISARHFETHWKSAFLLLSVFNGVALVAIWIFLPETSKGVVGSGQYFIQGQFKRTMFQKRVIQNEGLPNQRLALDLYFRLLRHRTVVCPCVGDAIAFSIFYTVCSTFGPVLIESFHWSICRVTLAYLAPGLAFLVISILSSAVTDDIKDEVRNDPFWLEETLATSHAMAFMCGTIGLNFYGWFKSDEVPGLGIAGIVILTLGVSIEMMCTSVYLTECVEEFPASVVAFNTVTRAAGGIIGFFIVNEVIKNIGLGWCFSTFSLVTFFTSFLTVVANLRSIVRKWREEDACLLVK